ncbi:hypothetical protein [Herbiconiux liukaitaii]|uniref:hypothetical protein n=1 Tax=Herbiconiux liukaitaii TaxID=3342799 RepID=UPI0035B94C49
MPAISWDPIPPLAVARFDQAYQDKVFLPPRILFEGETGRIEWQQMNFRQPMYHRNLDVDELAYQIRGDRTLMTELGTAELSDGDFVRIPVGVGHDNYGRQESHILWYFPATLDDVAPTVRESAFVMPPFEGWTSAVVNEVHTDCLGGRHCDRAVQLSDETRILEQFHAEEERLQVMNPEPEVNSTVWIWKGETNWVGLTNVTDDDGRTYRRHRNLDEVQYQISGTRLLISANGVVEMTPGTFVHLPVGVAFASITSGSSNHITTVTTGKLDSVWDGATESTQWSQAEIEDYRARTFAGAPAGSAAPSVSAVPA